MTTDLIQSTVSAVQPVNEPALASTIQQRLDSLTKPPGSLGRLESLALRYGLIRGVLPPRTLRKSLYVFCADHGVTAEGISAFPAAVTPQMVRNFLRGGAAINVLCRRFAITPVIVDMGVNAPPESGALDRQVRRGTRNFAQEPAMSRSEAEQAIAAGIELAHAAASTQDLVAVGEMGIGNTTSAAAILSLMANIDPIDAVGRGTGLDDAGVQHKAAVVRRALDLHRPNGADPVAVLAAIGGFEIGGIAGFLLGAASRRIPVMMDGFITCAGALIACAIAPWTADYLFYSHQSAEHGHRQMLTHLNADPLFQLDLRLGEGTGAALGINLLETSLTLYHEMATFQEAAVSEKQQS